MGEDAPVTKGVPDSLEFRPGRGRRDMLVYECTVCGAVLPGTRTARKHDSCRVVEPCPLCERHEELRPSLGTEYGRVGSCPRCGPLAPEP